MRTGLILVAAFLLCACSSAPARPQPQALFSDELFAPRPDLPGVADIFALDDSMRAYLQTEIMVQAKRIGPRRALAEVLRTELKLDYDAEVTRTAAEAFEARAGNCLSLVLLTGVLARELGVPITYRSVHGTGSWSRSEDIVFLSGHINVELGTPIGTGQRGAVAVDRPLIVDFVPPRDIGRQYIRPVSESTVLAMFMNNRAAESLVEGRVRQAYWWARSAIETDPSLLTAFNTLGVVYMRHGAVEQAGRILRYAHEREPGNSQVLANLVKLTAQQGQIEESERYAGMLAEIQTYPPFYFLDRGLDALAAGDADRALSLFKKALARMPYDHEVHFGIALANLQRGDPRGARQHLVKAVDGSPTRERRAIYAAKLDRLNAQRVN